MAATTTTYTEQALIDHLATQPGDWTSIASLRAAFPAWNLDEALRVLHLHHGYPVVPESNQKALDEATRTGALRIGGQWKHYIGRP